MAGYLPDHVVEEIRIRNDIIDVVSEYLKLDRKGHYYFGLCPFHKEKTPSFSVTPSKQIYFCYGCQKGGNVFHFIMNVENLDYGESLRFLAERVKMELPEGDDEKEREVAKRKQEIIRMNAEAARYFFGQLSSTQYVFAKDYLTKRGILDTTIRHFGLGYSANEGDDLCKSLLKAGFDETLILESGLGLKSKHDKLFDRFRGRIMFPIFDVRGNIIGFGGRVMDDTHPKYMNSPESSVYQKGRNLYALNFAKTSKEKRILVVEGYMDVISLHQCGIINTVASLGTALTESQGRILKKYTEEIIISYDADTAGQAATMRGLDILDQIGCNVKVLLIPEGKDPDEFIRRKGKEEFHKLIEDSISLVEYKMKVLRSKINFDTTGGKIEFLNKSADVLAKLDNSVEREMYTQKIAKDYGVSFEAMSSEIIKRLRPRTTFNNTIKRPVSYGGSQSGVKTNDLVQNNSLDEMIVREERLLLLLISLDNSTYKRYKDQFLKCFEYEENIKLMKLIADRLDANKDIVPGELFSLMTEESAREFAKIVQNECNFEDNQVAVLSILKRIEGHKIEKRIKEVRAILKNRESLKEGDVSELEKELNVLVIKKMRKT